MQNYDQAERCPKCGFGKNGGGLSATHCWNCGYGKKYYAISPVQDIVELCEFDGTFDEGEGMSMGSPITWKYPNNCTPIQVLGKLQDYDENFVPFLAKAIEITSADKIWCVGIPGGNEGWYDKSQIVDISKYPKVNL